jgi:putative ABC transport system substrate-binding protein
MRRRNFLNVLGGAVAWPFVARAQQGGRLRRIGMLETVTAAANVANFDAFRRGLRELGYVEGRNVTIEYRSADGRPERFPALAAELVRLPVDVIVTRGTPAALAAKQATTTIPVVMAAIGEPLGVGVVASLAHPGGNVTGFSAFVTQLSGKRVEVMKEAFPAVARAGYLNNMSNPQAPPQWEATQVAARALGVAVELLDVRAREDLPRAFAAAADGKLGAPISIAAPPAWSTKSSKAHGPAIFPSSSRPRSSWWST